MKDFLVFTLGVTLGYLLVQGLAYFQHNVGWVLFYH